MVLLCCVLVASLLCSVLFVFEHSRRLPRARIIGAHHGKLSSSALNFTFMSASVKGTSPFLIKINTWSYGDFGLM